MCANEFEKKENQKLIKIKKKIMATYISMMNFAKVATLVESLNSSVDKNLRPL